MVKFNPYEQYIMQTRIEKPINKMTLVFNSDNGVDDSLAQLLILSQTAIADEITLAGIVATVGNAILGQTEINVRRILELVQQKNIPVYPGAITPLGLEKNVSQIDAAINATHFYGHDGLSDQPLKSWPIINIPLQNKKGYEFMAELIFNASAENAIRLISTAALTEVYKTLIACQKLCEIAKLPPGCFAKNLVIVAMGGVIDPASGANAPFDWPDYNNKTCTPKRPPCKDAEANFYWDTPATQGVFDISSKYGIKIQLITLDLTQKPGLLWTKAEVKGLRSINNRVASQIANVTDVVPWLDAKHFLNGTFPWHDGLTAAWLLWKELFIKKEVAIKIGSHGETLINTDPRAKANVELISILPEKMALCMQRVVSLFNNFNQIQVIKDRSSATGFAVPLGELPSSAASSNLLPPIYFLPGKLVSTMGSFFHRKQEKSYIRVSSREKPCFYPDQSTNILGQVNAQSENALIERCKLSKEDSTVKNNALSFKNGFVFGALSQIFFKQKGLNGWEKRLAIQGAMAATMAAYNLPLACLYIASTNLLENTACTQVMTAFSGLSVLASANPWELLLSGLSDVLGYQVALNLIDYVMDSSTKDDELTLSL